MLHGDGCQGFAAQTTTQSVAYVRLPHQDLVLMARDAVVPAGQQPHRRGMPASNALHQSDEDLVLYLATRQARVQAHRLGAHESLTTSRRRDLGLVICSWLPDQLQANHPTSSPSMTWSFLVVRAELSAQIHQVLIRFV